MKKIYYSLFIVLILLLPIQVYALTLGQTAIMSSRSGAGVDDITAIQHILGGTGCFYSMSIYISATGGNAIMGIYDGASPTPVNLVASTATFAQSSTGWITVPLTSNTTLTEGNTYWVAWQTDTGTASQYAYQAGAVNKRASDNTGTYPVLNDPYVKTGNSAQDWSIYASYTLGVCEDYRYLTAIFLSPISSMIVNGSNVANNSVTQFLNSYNTSVYVPSMLSYFKVNGNAHTHDNPSYLLMNINHTVIAYPLMIDTPTIILPNNQGSNISIYLGIILSCLISVLLLVYFIRRKTYKTMN